MKQYYTLGVIFAAFNFIQCLPTQQNDFELLILHNNDMHSRFEETSQRSSTCKTVDKQKNECYGGFARTAHVIRKARKAAVDGIGPNVIYLNAGDTYTGTQWFNVHKAKIVTEFLNILHPDAMSFGNHEFDFKVQGVLPFINAAHFPIVAANLDFSKEPTLQSTNITKSVILEVAGIKLGVIGYLTPDTAIIASPENVIFNNEVISIKEESEKLHKEGINIIIALGHSGIQTDIEIAKNVPLVDIVIGGHTNTFLWNGKKPDIEEPYGPYPLVIEQKSGKKVYVVQAYAYTKYMGYLNVKFDASGNVVSCLGQPILLNSSIPQDKDVLDVLEQYRFQVEQVAQERIGKTRVVIDGTDVSCRNKECNFGNLIADAFVAYHASTYSGLNWTDAPIALMNGGSIRNSIEPNGAEDSITRSDLLTGLPFDNPIVLLTLQGDALLKVLETGVRSNGETSRGEFLQVSGLHVVYDLSKPVGSRVVQAKARCSACKVPVYEPIDPKKSYRIITTGYLEGGGDAHTVLKEQKQDVFDEGIVDCDAVAWYISKHSPVYPEEDERIVFIQSERLITKSTSNSIARISFSLLSCTIIVSILI